MAAVEANRRLAVVLAADIVGYSRLMAADEDATIQTLATYQEVIGELVTEHAGRIFSLAGDGIMVEFASAVQAVRCAVAIQRMAARRNGDLAEDRQVAFRIGLNLGDVVARGDDLLGDGVNVAARLQALAEPEQICISAAVREQIEDKVAFGCDSLGQHSLKHIPRPVHVYVVDWALQAPLPVAQLRSGPPPLPDRPSIAVLPFANMSQDMDQEYFADGLSEDLITALAKYRWFFVIARNSSFTYKGRAVSVQQVGRELGVRYVLEGSIRRAGNRVRVTAQLVEAETGHHLWADRYDRELADLFAHAGRDRWTRGRGDRARHDALGDAQGEAQDHWADGCLGSGLSWPMALPSHSHREHHQRGPCVLSPGHRGRPGARRELHLAGPLPERDDVFRLVGGSREPISPKRRQPWVRPCGWVGPRSLCTVRGGHPQQRDRVRRSRRSLQHSARSTSAQASPWPTSSSARRASWPVVPPRQSSRCGAAFASTRTTRSLSTG